VDRDEHRKLIADVLAAADLDVDEVGEDRWMTMLSGQWKRTIPLLLDLDERSLRLTSLLCGAPDEGHAEVYRLVLHRNEKLTWVHFALDDEGDVVLTGAIPREVLSPAVLDEVLGQVLLTADETYNSVLRAGFATYIEAEQAWRAKAGLPPNPVSTEG
jgi:hypothetical protein